MWFEFTLLLGLTIFLFYRWSIANKDFFKERGLTYDEPFPLFGSMKDIVFRKMSILDLVIKLYKKHKGS